MGTMRPSSVKKVVERVKFVLSASSPSSSPSISVFRVNTCGTARTGTCLVPLVRANESATVWRSLQSAGACSAPPPDTVASETGMIAISCTMPVNAAEVAPRL